MKTSQMALVVFLGLILVQSLLHSPMLPCHGRQVHLLRQRQRNQPRRSLVSVASFATSLDKNKTPVQKSADTSLRKAPSSKSNPTQNK
ncbi:hypothetical protein FNV43_RR03028 [Rhamnella rubrinervis]|uniref:Uncharacterized protein n=1 Tax=Rhamnella rubrinervis TaxID=2594499 RepID=A0A8K0HIZ5_9ROSA|nr:hypothetical protein FNV43_RR03028 [Rhamnella rubrinervis]